MAVNETIVTGRKFRKLIDEANKLWQRISFWTKASDVEFDDGTDAETKFGALNGITDSLTSTSSNIAASAAAVKALNDKITQLNSDLAWNFSDSIEFTAPYTCPSSGIVYAGLRPGDKMNAYAALFINGIEVARTQNFGSSGFMVCQNYKVNKGDVITTKTLDSDIPVLIFRY